MFRLECSDEKDHYTVHNDHQDGVFDKVGKGAATVLHTTLLGAAKKALSNGKGRSRDNALSGIRNLVNRIVNTAHALYDTADKAAGDITGAHKLMEKVPEL